MICFFLGHRWQGPDFVVCGRCGSIDFERLRLRQQEAFVKAVLAGMALVRSISQATLAADTCTFRDDKNTKAEAQPVWEPILYEVCAWCGKGMRAKPCVLASAGFISHGLCEDCFRFRQTGE